jgi:flagellar motor switch/type III secretory pathway protein FliN
MATASMLPASTQNEFDEGTWQEARYLPCRLNAHIPVRGFTMGDLMRIEVGSIVDSGMAVETDLDVSVNGAQVGCGKLDLTEEKLAVRLTELA